ncbi:uncharacterized protein LOC142231975 [Haematobia irritans]|uniref:Putative secreted protein n=2 Tax=Haematobia irritans TaxID=7368 RepID=A0A1L8EGM4_HAEIR
MFGTSVKYLLTIAAVLILTATAQPTQLIRKPIALTNLAGRSLFDQYTLGQDIDGAKIIYTSQNQDSFDTIQSQITSSYVFPAADSNNDSIITKITLYVEASDDATTQAYVIDGGIGETAITLEIVANNSDFLRYMVIIYGK